MSDLSNYLEGELYDLVLRGSTWQPPLVVYAALFTAVSSAEAGTGTEVSASGYARQPVTFTAPTDGAGSNSAAVDFGPLSGTGTVTHCALFDALTSGNPLTAIKPLQASRTWQDGDTVRFQAGDLDFSFA